MKLGFIGCGNMATAMIKGILDSGCVTAGDIMASARTDPSRKRIAKELGIQAANSNPAVAQFSDILFLAVKPQQYQEVIGEIQDSISDKQIVVTIAPGKTLSWLEEKFGKKVKLIRTMPNTPALVKECMLGMCCNDAVSAKEVETVVKLCESFGKVELIPEKLMDAVVGVSGSSPAYVFMFIEAMADAAVADGMPRAQAYKFAAQSVLGSAKMVLETGMHPGQLKDMVCSPGGTTIEAVQILEEKGFRSAVIEAQRACTRKAKGV